jgi:ribosomal protein S12 methylthiotransferase
VDDVPAERLKQERADAIMELQQGHSMELNEARVGETYRCCSTARRSGRWWAVNSTRPK